MLAAPPPVISQPGFGAAGWFATTVPTTALGTLVRHGVYPDPYVGTNNMRIPDAISGRTDASSPKNEHAGKAILLLFGSRWPCPAVGFAAQISTL